ncbi:MAG: fatty acid desaturase [Betaproteobacteria bacterium]|nr:fatty acid desaturase [Betaproteobacteria bacterium]
MTGNLAVQITDPCPQGDAPRNALERACMRWLRDVRDLAFVRLALRAGLQLTACAALLFAVPGWLAGLLALPYLWLLYAAYGGPVMLMVHALEHRPAFTGRGRWLQAAILHGLPLLYGLSPFAYRAHHLLMHHAEENRPQDLSSTLRYRRDSPADFLRYYLRFLVLGNFELARYLRAHGRRRALRRFVAGECAHLALLAAGLLLAPAAATATLLLPYALTRFFLMAGNWAQHAFVQIDALDDGVRNATILVNASHNHRCFNDGYHALHHRHPGLHWAEMSASFRAEWRYYAERGVIVFSDIANNQVVWWRLMRGDYGYLAERMLDHGGLPRERDQRIALLRARAQARPA